MTTAAATKGDTMTTYEIWHNDTGGFRTSPAEAVRASFPQNYTLVATVKADNLDHAYAMSQNLDAPWAELQEVRAADVVEAAGGCRSTSVGDLIINMDFEDVDGDEANRIRGAHQVEGIGFRLVGRLVRIASASRLGIPTNVWAENNA